MGWKNKALVALLLCAAISCKSAQAEDELADTSAMEDEFDLDEIADFDAPPDTMNSPRRISFDYSTNVDEELEFDDIDEGLDIVEGSPEDEEYSQWSVVTPEGYEYDGSTSELKTIFEEANDPNAPESLESDDSEESIIDITSSLDSFDPVTARMESVFPPDTRKKVTRFLFPHSAMGRIDSGCTGTFIGPRHVLTAGHCVFSRRTKKWLKNLNFRRRKNCNPNQGTLYKWKRALAPKGWTKKLLASHDYALIVVKRRSPVRMSYGYKNSLSKINIKIAGYPGDKPGRCMWRTGCRLTHVFSLQLGYRCDTFGGMSGSAVRPASRNIIYCVHAYGRSSSKNYNKCTRITRARFNILRKWIRNN